MRAYLSGIGSRGLFWKVKKEKEPSFGSNELHNAYFKGSNSANGITQMSNQHIVFCSSNK
jgi:hypothetical protein